jgi:hypothetical protein
MSTLTRKGRRGRGRGWSRQGEAVIHVSLSHHSLTAVYLEAGVDVNVRNEYGQTPLYLACRRISWHADESLKTISWRADQFLGMPMRF